MNFALTERQQAIYDQVGELGRTNFAPRAAGHEATGRTPADNLDDLFKAGLFGAAIAAERGGLDGGPLHSDPLLPLLIVEQTARYCPSTSQSIHIHFNLTHRLDVVGTPEQRARILPGILKHGHLVNGTASEPGRTARGLYNLQTTAEKVSGGWLLNGHKNYATLGDVAHWFTISAVIKGQKAPEGHLTFLVPSKAEGLRVLADSWNPYGLRAAYSPDLVLENVFVPDRDVLGDPGETARNKWQAKAHLSFAAQYIGSSEGIFDFLVDYLPKRGTAGDSYAQLRLGEIRIATDSARWMVYRAAWLWQAGDLAAAELFAMNAKYQAMESARLVIDRAPQIAGSSALAADSVLSRFLRDLRYQLLHENQDKTASTVGKYHLGQNFDVTARL